jgi:hypothetical protein
VVEGVMGGISGFNLRRGGGVKLPCQMSPYHRLKVSSTIIWLGVLVNQSLHIQYKKKIVLKYLFLRSYSIIETIDTKYLVFFFFLLLSLAFDKLYKRSFEKKKT